MDPLPPFVSKFTNENPVMGSVNFTLNNERIIYMIIINKVGLNNL